MKTVFLICPVRNATETQKQRMTDYIEGLEKTCVVYYPARDTNQNDDIGFRICQDNKTAIVKSDEVHIFWDADSQGSLFDLGMAFAFDKPLVLVNIEDVTKTPQKSFQNMIMHWASTIKG